MMKRVVRSCVLLASLTVMGMRGTAQQIMEHKRNTVYAAAFTRGPVYALNFDRLFWTGKKFSYSYRIGFYALNNEIALPLSISLISGKQAHHAELSVTVTPFVDRFSYLFREGNRSDKYLHVIPGVGYRYQPASGGLFFTALFGPMLVLDPRSDNFWNMDPRWYGVLTAGLGWTF